MNKVNQISFFLSFQNCKSQSEVNYEKLYKIDEFFTKQPPSSHCPLKNYANLSLIKLKRRTGLPPPTLYEIPR